MINLDNTSVYEILDCFGPVTGGGATIATDATQNLPYSYYVNHRVRLIGGQCPEPHQSMKLTAVPRSNTSITARWTGVTPSTVQW